MSDRRVAIVVGMHRSGTSLLAKSLEVFGFEHGDRLMLAQADNPKGFFEDQDIVDLDNEMLAVVGRAWDSVRPLTAREVALLRRRGYAKKAAELLETKLSRWPRFVLKDPRMSKLREIWSDALRMQGCPCAVLVSVRHPAAIYFSLEKRNKIDQAVAAWMIAAQGVENARWARSLESLHVGYEDLIRQPEKQLRRIGCRFNWKAKGKLSKLFAEDFLDTSFNHAPPVAQQQRRLASMPAIVREIYAIQKKLCQDACPVPPALEAQTLDLWHKELVRCAGLLQTADDARLESTILKAKLARQDALLEYERVSGKSSASLVEERTAWAKKLEGELGLAREAYLKKEEELEQRTQWAQGLDEELGSLRAAFAREQGLVAERTAWAKKLEGELEAAREHYAVLQQNARP